MSKFFILMLIALGILIVVDQQLYFGQYSRGIMSMFSEITHYMIR